MFLVLQYVPPPPVLVVVFEVMFEVVLFVLAAFGILVIPAPGTVVVVALVALDALVVPDVALLLMLPVIVALCPEIFVAFVALVPEIGGCCH